MYLFVRIRGLIDKIYPDELLIHIVRVRSILLAWVNEVYVCHAISASVPQDLNKTLMRDILIYGDDKDSKGLVTRRVRDVKNMGTLDIGPLKTLSLVESLTSMLLNITRRNKLKDASINIIPEGAHCM
jgi:hypothetical protein